MKDFEVNDQVTVISESGWSGTTSKLSRVMAVDKEKGEVRIAGSNAVFSLKDGQDVMNKNTLDHQGKIVPLINLKWDKVKWEPAAGKDYILNINYEDKRPGDIVTVERVTDYKGRRVAICHPKGEPDMQSCFMAFPEELDDIEK